MLIYLDVVTIAPVVLFFPLPLVKETNGGTMYVNKTVVKENEISVVKVFKGRDLITELGQKG